TATATTRIRRSRPTGWRSAATRSTTTATARSTRSAPPAPSTATAPPSSAASPACARPARPPATRPPAAPGWRPPRPARGPPGAGTDVGAAPGGDVNYTDPTTNPGAHEICGNGIDEDCNGRADDGCAPCPAAASCANLQTCTSGK